MADVIILWYTLTDLGKCSKFCSMASLWKSPESQFWIACFRDANGRQRRLTTRMTDRRKAQRVAEEFEAASRTQRALQSTRRVIERLHEEIGGEPVPRKTLRTYAQEWLAAKESEVSPRTHHEYSKGISRLLDFLGPRADEQLDRIVKADLLAYRNHMMARGVTPTTANNALALTRMLFVGARRDEVCVSNPAEFVGAVRTRTQSEARRRPFTLPELQAVLSVADPEWRSLVIFGLYSGQRLGDIARLSWANIDLQRGEMRLTTSKTGRVMVIPLAPPLRSHIESLPAGDNPSAPLHPRACDALGHAGNNMGALSAQFAELLVQAGLRAAPAPRSHQSRGVGHSGRRRINELSFHSLRRTATSLLHEAGVPASVAQALIGHDSEEIHHDYIGIGREALRSAVNRFPEL
jgi:integrase